MDIFYDFDGTLFDTYPIMVDAFGKTAQNFQVKVDQKKIYHEMRQAALGVTIKNFSKQVGISYVDFDREFRKNEANILMNSKPFEYVKEILEKVVKSNGRNFLLTHRNRVTFELLEKFNLKMMFTDFITGDMDFPRKPNPASLQYLIEQNKINKKTAYMIGDRNLDIDAAHNAGIKGILFDPDQMISVASNPEYQTNSFKKIDDYLAKNFNNPL